MICMEDEIEAEEQAFREKHAKWLRERETRPKCDAICRMHVGDALVAEFRHSRSLFRGWAEVHVVSTPRAQVKRPGARGWHLTCYSAGTAVGTVLEDWAVRVSNTGKDDPMPSVDVTGRFLTDSRTVRVDIFQEGVLQISYTYKDAYPVRFRVDVVAGKEVVAIALRHLGAEFVDHQRGGETGLLTLGQE
jgi:hypothetical protein